MARKAREEFTLEERQRIHVMLREGKGFGELGRVLLRDRRVVKRVAERYRSENPIVRRSQSALERASWDHEEHKKRLRGPKQRRRLKTKERRDYVEKRLEKASPELIAGRYKLEHPGESMSHESIYQWIYRERPDMIQTLELVSKRGNRKRSSNRQYRFKEPAASKCSISERAAAGNDRTEFGHLERDSVMGKKEKGPCLQNISDRKVRVIWLSKLHACNAAAASAATEKRLKLLPEPLRRSMTQDNGPENANHAEEEKTLKLKQHFCHPYSAWERGTVEKFNRSAVRRFFPKGTDFSTVNLSQVSAAEAFHNNRPMKCLGFRTPLELLREELTPFELTPADIGLQYVPW